MFKRYNIQTDPWLYDLEPGNLALVFTQHAINQALKRNIKLMNKISAGKGSVVEAESENGRPTKLVIRLNYNVSQDIIYVVVPRGLNYRVITVWLNNKEDTHQTLNYARLSQVG